MRLWTSKKNTSATPGSTVPQHDVQVLDRKDQDPNKGALFGRMRDSAIQCDMDRNDEDVVKSFLDGKSFCINLKQRKDRWTQAQGEFDKLSVTAERFDAIYCKDDGARGCAQSFVEILKGIVMPVTYVHTYLPCSLLLHQFF
eukprot:Rmarinus@m.25650